LDVGNVKGCFWVCEFGLVAALGLFCLMLWVDGLAAPLLTFFIDKTVIKIQKMVEHQTVGFCPIAVFFLAHQCLLDCFKL